MKKANQARSFPFGGGDDYRDNDNYGDDRKYRQASNDQKK